MRGRYLANISTTVERETEYVWVQQLQEMKHVTLPGIQRGEKNWVFQVWEAIPVEGADGRESKPRRALFEVPFFHVLLWSKRKPKKERREGRKEGRN